MSNKPKNREAIPSFGPSDYLRYQVEEFGPYKTGNSLEIYRLPPAPAIQDDLRRARDLWLKKTLLEGLSNSGWSTISRSRTETIRGLTRGEWETEHMTQQMSANEALEFAKKMRDAAQAQRLSEQYNKGGLGGLPSLGEGETGEAKAKAKPAKTTLPAPAPTPAPSNEPPEAPLQPIDMEAKASASIALGPVLGGAVETLARSVAQDVVQTLRRHVAPVVLELRAPGSAPKILEGRQHPSFQETLRLVAAGVNVLLVGPAGCGKTHMSRQIAEALDLPFGAISGSAGASEAQLTGRLLPTGEGGRFEYVSTPFVDLYQEGGVFLFDEMDAFDPNALLVVNSALANGGFFVESRKAGGGDPWIKRHDKAVMIGAANTYGQGMGTMYVGRSQLDAATLDRWYVIEMDYDEELEREMGEEAVVTWVWKIRRRAREAQLRRVVSTRMISKGSAAVRAGLEISRVKRQLLAGWTKDELSKIGESV